MYKYLEDFIGNTPLVRLKRIPGETSNVLLVKLEGNNPAGSVKDRPAFSMIRHAQQRGEIKPGDALIEATSGNTGIALAMAAAMLGYRMNLHQRNGSHPGMGQRLSVVSLGIYSLEFLFGFGSFVWLYASRQKKTEPKILRSMSAAAEK